MDIDLTILFQLSLFLILLVSLTNIILKPFLGVLEARFERTQGSIAEVTRLERLADENRTAYQARIHEARTVARREREGMRTAASEENRKTLAEVRAEISDKLNRTREEVAKAESSARAALGEETDHLARQIVSKIIDREVSA